MAHLTKKPMKEEAQLVVPLVEKTIVDLPEIFSTLKPSDQYVYLTRVLKLTPEEANEVMYNEV